MKRLYVYKILLAVLLAVCVAGVVFIIGSVQGQVLTNCMPGRKAGILMLWPPQRMELRLWPDMR